MQNEVLLKTMKEKAESVQAVVSHIKNMEEAFCYVSDLTRRQGGSTVTAPGLNIDERIALQETCVKQGLRFLSAPLRNHLREIHTSLTFADWGIAETGTLVLDSSSEDLRIATMLAESHVAILPASRLKPDAMSLESELTALQKASPRYMAFITGPSRTADIERVLTIGVHGPRELHILIMEENES